MIILVVVTATMWFSNDRLHCFSQSRSFPLRRSHPLPSCGGRGLVKVGGRAKEPVMCGRGRAPLRSYLTFFCSLVRSFVPSFVDEQIYSYTLFSNRVYVVLHVCIYVYYRRSDPNLSLALMRRPRGTWAAGGTPPCGRLCSRAWARGCTPSTARRTRRACRPTGPAANDALL